MKRTSFLILVQLFHLVVRLTPAEWRRQSIYFIMTDRFARTDGSLTAPCNVTAGEYCGGTWTGIINKLDYIQNMGFTAIWVTPVTHQIQTSPAYHGYWQDDLYNVNPEYGTSDDLKALSKALHDRGMYLMLDVVANHFAYTGPPNETFWTTYNPFNSKEYFHDPAAINYTNQTSIEIGWLVVDPTPVVLPDVFTKRQDVRDLYYAWINDLVANYSADGLRVDTVRHVEQDFWSGFNAAAGVYCVGEVFNTDNITYLCDYQNYMDGILNYGTYAQIQNAFVNSTGNMSALAAAVVNVSSTCKDTSLLGSFMENHDNPRFPNSTTDIVEAANAIAYTMLADGIPIIYQGQEQHLTGGQDPNNREAIWLTDYNTNAELYEWITLLNQIRTNVINVDESYLTYKATPIYVDGNTIVMRKGSDGTAVIAVLSNLGSNGTTYTLTVPGTGLGYTPGTSLTELLSCTEVTVAQDGSLAVQMSTGQPRMFYASSQIGGICH